MGPGLDGDWQGGRQSARGVGHKAWHPPPSKFLLNE